MSLTYSDKLRPFLSSSHSHNNCLSFDETENTEEFSTDQASGCWRQQSADQ